jgi:hypothetical protein
VLRETVCWQYGRINEYVSINFSASSVCVTWLKIGIEKLSGHSAEPLDTMQNQNIQRCTENDLKNKCENLTNKKQVMPAAYRYRTMRRNLHLPVFVISKSFVFIIISAYK